MRQSASQIVGLVEAALTQAIWMQGHRAQKHRAFWWGDALRHQYSEWLNKSAIFAVFQRIDGLANPAVK
jgi:hypothetical protein